MSQYLSIPVERASQIGLDFNKTHVVIVCYDEVKEVTYATTWGLQAHHKIQAARLGDILAKATGADMENKRPADEHFVNQMDAALFAEAKQLLTKIHRYEDRNHALRAIVGDFLERAKVLARS